MLVASLPIGKPIQSNLFANITNCHSRQWKESRRITNLSYEHMDAMVASIRGYQVGVHHSMGGSSSKISNPKLDSLEVRGVNDEPLQTSSLEYNFNANINSSTCLPFRNINGCWFYSLGIAAMR